MRWTRITSALWVLALGLWGGTASAAFMSSGGDALAKWEYILTRPVFTAFAATLSIGLVAWQMTRPLAEVSIMYAMGYGHGVSSVKRIDVAEPRASDGGTVSRLHSRR